MLGFLRRKRADNENNTADAAAENTAVTEEKPQDDFEEMKKELRESLLAGGFGQEAESSPDDDDAQADEEVVNEFLSMFGAEGDSALKGHDWVAYVPGSIAEDPSFSGALYGIIREETESVYIFDAPMYASQKYLIGSAGTEDTDIPDKPWKICGSFEDGKLVLTVFRNIGGDAVCQQSYPVRVKQYDTVTKLFSRNTGLLESAAMLDKRAVLVGCGSVGSFVAMELARSGVGKFLLCDTDTLEMHNICRHQCGFDDLGRYKVDAVKDKILNINPNAEVITYRKVIQRVPEDELLPLLGRNTIIIGGGDNRASSDWACKLAIKTDSTFVSTGCWTRAFAGEIFYWASGRKLSCYTCALGGLIDNERPESHANYFGTDKEMESLAFEPGIAADIDFVTIIAVKLALDLLNRDNENYTPRVINYLRQYTWVCNTNSTKIGGEKAGIFAHPLQITHNLSVNRNADCPCCGDHHE